MIIFEIHSAVCPSTRNNNHHNKRDSFKRFFVKVNNGKIETSLRV